MAAPIRLRVINVAGDAPNLASTLIQSGFNLGNAVGPFAGAAALSAGLGYGQPPWLGADGVRGCRNSAVVYLAGTANGQRRRAGSNRQLAARCALGYDQQRGPA